jgi:hypothetical protein
MSILKFTVAYSTTLSEVEGQTPSINVYAEDLNNCDLCVNETGSCWPCLLVTQQVFKDESLTVHVDDGYYMLKYYENSNPSTWHIIGGYPQPEGFFN